MPYAVRMMVVGRGVSEMGNVSRTDGPCPVGLTDRYINNVALFLLWVGW